jgi:hypothetical protein
MKVPMSEMTLRDYFAAKAMQAIISTSQHSTDGSGTGDMLSGEYVNSGGEPVNEHGDKSYFDLTLRWAPKAAYLIADAMLKDRKSK